MVRRKGQHPLSILQVTLPGKKKCKNCNVLRCKLTWHEASEIRQFRRPYNLRPRLVRHPLWCRIGMRILQSNSTSQQEPPDMVVNLVPTQNQRSWRLLHLQQCWWHYSGPLFQRSAILNIRYTNPTYRFYWHMAARGWIKQTYTHS